MNIHIRFACVPFVCLLMFSMRAWGTTPVATVTPVDVPGTTAFSATILDLIVLATASRSSMSLELRIAIASVFH